MRSIIATGLLLIAGRATAIPAVSSPQTATISTPDFAGALAGGNGSVTGVSATYYAPSLTNYKTKANGQAVVSIDTYQCSSYLQAGIRWTSTPAGNFQIKAFAQWGPAAPHIFDLKVKPGDWLSVQVKETAPGAGYASITRGDKTVTAEFKNMGHLCGQNAAWGVVDPLYNATSPSQANTLGNYQDVVFFNAAYSVTDKQGRSESYDCSAATPVEMVRNVTGTPSTFSHAGIYQIYTESIAVWYGA